MATISDKSNQYDEVGNLSVFYVIILILNVKTYFVVVITKM